MNKVIETNNNILKTHTLINNPNDDFHTLNFNVYQITGENHTTVDSLLRNSTLIGVYSNIVCDREEPLDEIQAAFKEQHPDCWWTPSDLD